MSYFNSIYTLPFIVVVNGVAVSANRSERAKLSHLGKFGYTIATIIIDVSKIFR